MDPIYQGTIARHYTTPPISDAEYEMNKIKNKLEFKRLCWLEQSQKHGIDFAFGRKLSLAFMLALTIVVFASYLIERFF